MVPVLPQAHEGNAKEKTMKTIYLDCTNGVSGDMVLDLDSAPKPTDIRLTTVSGEIAIR